MLTVDVPNTCARNGNDPSYYEVVKCSVWRSLRLGGDMVRATGRCEPNAEAQHENYIQCIRSTVFARWPQRARPFSTRFIGPIPFTVPNGS